MPSNPVQNIRSADPNLLQWLAGALGRNLETPVDLEQITSLEAKDFHWGAPVWPDWLEPVPGDWSLLGTLPNLEKLEFPNIPDAGMRYSFTQHGPTRFCWSGINSFSFLLKCRTLKYLDLSGTNFYESWYLETLTGLEHLVLPPAELSDFSFLARCQGLVTLDISRTNFRNCTALLSLPRLEQVFLPAKRDLIHFEVTHRLRANVQTMEPEPKEAGPLPFYLSRRKSPLGENGFYAQIIVVNGRKYGGMAITKELVQQLKRDIRAGGVNTLTVSADPDLERVLFIAEIKDSWTALALQDFEENVCYLPCNTEYEGADEPAPPRAGRQSPVPKSQAVCDLALTAECAERYIKSGKLSSRIRWIQEE